MWFFFFSSCVAPQKQTCVSSLCVVLSINSYVMLSVVNTHTHHRTLRMFSISSFVNLFCCNSFPDTRHTLCLTEGHQRSGRWQQVRAEVGESEDVGLQRPRLSRASTATCTEEGHALWCGLVRHTHKHHATPSRPVIISHFSYLSDETESKVKSYMDMSYTTERVRGGRREGVRMGVVWNSCFPKLNLSCRSWEAEDHVVDCLHWLQWYFVKLL